MIGSYAYLTGWPGLQVIDISILWSLREAGFYDTPGSAVGVAVAGAYAYVADREAGLRIIKILNPWNPREMGFYDTSGYPEGVAVAGSYVYVADYGQALPFSNIPGLQPFMIESRIFQNGSRCCKTIPIPSISRQRFSILYLRERRSCSRFTMS